jgi:hypothetical protein
MGETAAPAPAGAKHDSVPELDEIQKKIDEAIQARLDAKVDEKVNTILASHKRKLQKENDELRKKLEEKGKTEAPKTEEKPDPTPAPGDLKGQLELLEKKMQRQAETLNNELTAARKERDKERDRRLTTERDKEIGDALTAAGCNDMIGGRRYVTPQVEYEDDKWVFRTKKDNIVSILEGVAEELPAYLRQAQMANGGSGFSSSSTKSLAKVKLLEMEKKTLAELKAKAEKTANPNDILSFTRQKKKIEALEAER